MNNSDKKITFRIPDHIISAREFLDLFPSEMSDEDKDKLAAKMEKRYADHQTVTEDEKRFREILIRWPALQAALLRHTTDISFPVWQTRHSRGCLKNSSCVKHAKSVYLQ